MSAGSIHRRGESDVSILNEIGKRSGICYQPDLRALLLHIDDFPNTQMLEKKHFSNRQTLQTRIGRIKDHCASVRAHSTQSFLNRWEINSHRLIGVLYVVYSVLWRVELRRCAGNGCASAAAAALIFLGAR